MDHSAVTIAEGICLAASCMAIGNLVVEVFFHWCDRAYERQYRLNAGKREVERLAKEVERRAKEAAERATPEWAAQEAERAAKRQARLDATGWTERAEELAESRGHAQFHLTTAICNAEALAADPDATAEEKMNAQRIVERAKRLVPQFVEREEKHAALKPIDLHTSWG